MSIVFPWDTTEESTQPVLIESDEKILPGEKILIRIDQRVSFGSYVNQVMLGARIAQIHDDPRFITDGSIKWILNEFGEPIGAEIKATLSDNPAHYSAGVGWLTPAVIIGLVVGLAAIMFSVSIYRVADAYEDTADLPSVKTAAISLPIFAVAAVIIGVYLWVKK
jgi:hypothetical protein